MLVGDVPRPGQLHGLAYRVLALNQCLKLKWPFSFSLTKRLTLHRSRRLSPEAGSTPLARKAVCAINYPLQGASKAAPPRLL